MKSEGPPGGDADVDGDVSVPIEASTDADDATDVPSVPSDAADASDAADSPDAVYVAAVSSAHHVAVSPQAVCFIPADGYVRCFGADNWNVLGRTKWDAGGAPGDMNPDYVSGPDGGHLKAVAVSAAWYTGCAIRESDRKVYCWGGAYDGRTGTTPSNSGAVSPVAATDGDLTNVVDVAVGFDPTCARTTSNEVYCWGKHSDWGALTSEFAALMTTWAAEDHGLRLTALTGSTAISVGAGASGGCAVKGGNVLCWGRDDTKQTGALPKDPCPQTPIVNLCTLTPTKVDGVTGALVVDVGQNHGCAIQSDGKVSCWGLNDHAQLGDGGFGSNECTFGGAKVPCGGASHVAAADGATAVTVGDAHTCAIKDGKVLCWGRNNIGQLGRGEGVSAAPDYVEKAASTPLTDVVEIDAGKDRTCALTKAGDLYCWGEPPIAGDVWWHATKINY